ncbi:uncharacterized protein B0T15DRAFT_233100 [Chaetomium strumarium]|uniref:UBC core domain-containing protein n=1 Tax=Chaetomium strumarium TaxID=1170767 RepID=A0AAJ0M0C3_9PEZI|nr:hypothetical protein B0T15DRAFT_233100 [Chaetomium strumarium]
MSLKKFKSDVSTAAQKAAKGGFAGVIFVGHGESDGEVVIKYRDEALPRDVRIQALAQYVSEYPDGNVFMLWTDEPDPPQPIVAAIEVAQDYLLGMSVCEMVSEVATRVEKEIARTTKGGNSESQTSDIELDDINVDGNNEDDDDASDYDAAYDEDFSSDGEEFGLPSLAGRRHSRQDLESTESRKPLLRRIRRDLRRVEQAGFKVGFVDEFGKTSTTGILSISIRVDKLALSNEAMEAWNLKPAEYVVLLLRFERPYTPLERILQHPASHTKVDLRIGRCDTYKPSLSQALVAFSESNSALGTASSSLAAQGSEHGSGSFEKLFISNSLDQFLCESFVSLLKLRETYGINWEQANEFLLSRIGLVAEDERPTEPTDLGNSSPDPDASPEPHPVPKQDHLLEKESASERSFPLIAMQFAMHYFVKCTKYCLRCHRRLENGFEALRPYVCSDPLCLFQYMAMGFGPSIEHEILSEPYVVDLLVSFCYAAIQPCGSIYPGGSSSVLPIRTLPVGLRLRVPNLASEVSDFLKAKVSADGTQLVFEAEGAKIFGERVAPMKWLAFRRPGQTLTQHARIHEVNSAAKTVHIEVMGQSAAAWGKKVNDPIYPMSSAVHSPTPGSVGSDVGIVEVFLYDTDFDSLDNSSKAVAMRHALDTLPRITEIQEWLISHPHSSFRSMDRISPAAASLLQWIISSNRSCIFQVDRPQDPSRKGNENLGAVGGSKNREHERILGMDGWVQFRFAQGSPDKELRFSRALQEVAARKGLRAHPTIFAWHGSSLSNWHSIVRTGLDFKDIRCGRAYGHGVYFSRHATTSMGYSAAGAHSWPGSALRITSCLSLNEIINAPDEFVSRDPHYVVPQLDWHQCRYLFVQTAPAGVQSGGWWRKVTNHQTDAAEQQASDPKFHQQAPGSEVYGQSGKILQIPLSAIPLRTVGSPAAASPSSPSKRAVERLEDGADEHTEEVGILFTDTDDESDAAQGPPRKKSASCAPSIDTTSTGRLEIAGDGPPTPCSTSRSLTDFEPGSLDLSTLPQLAPPSFATYAATKALSSELKRLQAVQANTPLHELGWYMDFDEVTNLFQWIVQLHTFDESLPLAKDMKSAGFTSIVLELRFGADFPFSPPFVRVVRPRFLPFGAGGGGHVTAGGAMCMELLTSSGWSPASSMESVLLQVRMALCNLEPQPARLDPAVRLGKKVGDYAVGEAIDAYIRAANMHGWEVPKDLRVTALGV